MELIIKIDEELYEAYKGKPPMLGDAGMDMIAQAIANGTPYNPSGDCISREGLKKKAYTAVILEPDEKGIDYVKDKRYVVDLEDIDNAPPVSDRYDEGYAQGYVDGSTGADWREIK